MPGTIWRITNFTLVGGILLVLVGVALLCEKQLRAANPKLALITDKALTDAQARSQLAQIYVLLMTTRFLGTLLAQLVIVPAALLIGYLVKLL